MDESPPPESAACISYWLVPEPSCRTNLQHIIDDVAASYAGPHFVPHMTIAVSPNSSSDVVRQTLHQAAATVAPLMLNPVDLLFSQHFTKSCFLQFKLNADLIQLSNFFQSSASPPSGYAFNPHMSLFYGSLSELQRHSMLKRVALPQTINFSELWAIQILNKTTTAKDVNDWQVVGKAKLRAAATPPANQNGQTPRGR